MWIVIILAAAGLIGAGYWVACRRRREIVRSRDTGRMWKPHCLYVSYDCRIPPDADPEETPDDARLVRVDVANPTPEPLPTYTPYPTLEPCPTCVPGSGACDYARIKADVATVVAGREPVRWPR